MIERDEEVHGKSPNAKMFVVISDGEVWSGEVKKTLDEAVARSIPVFVVGVGTLGGGKMPPYVGPDGQEVKDPEVPLYSRLDRASLQKVASEGHGQYFELDRDGDRHIANALIDAAKRRAPSLGVTEQSEDLYWRFLVIAAVCTIAGLLFLRERSELWIQLAGGILVLIALSTVIG